MAAPLPPLSSLRAFEAAARHMSFRKAAEELSVTPAAISHQLKTLEDYLGVRLFRRANRRVELTPAARAAVPFFHEGFKSIVEGVERLRQEELANTLTVSAASSFAGKWLMPRLHRFVSRYPQIDVRLLARMRSAHVTRALPVRRDINDTTLDDADVAIRFGDGDFPGMRVERLLDLSVTPMVSAQLLNAGHPLERIEDLRHYILLHDDTGYFRSGRLNWDCWLHAAGVSGIDTSHGVHFSHANLAIDAAVDGLGVVLSLPALAAPDLAVGRLITPFELRVPTDFSYYIICDPADAERPAIQAFTGWLLEEARRPLETA
jgi:LysR family transcriptional regulator, glycine cleavage system transcriptional activator